MVRLNPEGDVWYYPLEVEGDLLAIACKGKATGVTVGDDGVVLRTDDSGETWKQIDVGTRARLRSVILSGTDPAYIAGDGIVLRSDDDGHSFRPVPDAEGDFTSVTTTAKGTYAWLTTASGRSGSSTGRRCGRCSRRRRGRCRGSRSRPTARAWWRSAPAAWCSAPTTAGPSGRA
ncbi:WD40/YVTN/BNR-like repeat-containing protein [Nannocystis pusilla]|uniref:WD40/YVTN/BNR-like repeat-containing protein n=1 Tax=Nannocystis pusilla TaxID=889268 RepID=UPI003B76CA1E